MDEATHAYIRVHGDCPDAPLRRSGWYHDKAMFISGWACCLGSQEEKEIEEDVLYQQEGLVKGE